MITLCSFRSSTTWNWYLWAKINRFKLRSRFYPFSLYILHRNTGFWGKQVAMSDFTILRPCKSPFLLPMPISANSDIFITRSLGLAWWLFEIHVEFTSRTGFAASCNAKIRKIGWLRPVGKASFFSRNGCRAAGSGNLWVSGSTNGLPKPDPTSIRGDLVV